MAELHLFWGVLGQPPADVRRLRLRLRARRFARLREDIEVDRFREAIRATEPTRMYMNAMPATDGDCGCADCRAARGDTSFSEFMEDFDTYIARIEAENRQDG